MNVSSQRKATGIELYISRFKKVIRKTLKLIKVIIIIIIIIITIITKKTTILMLAHLDKNYIVSIETES
jgi:hypothetical protein